MDSREALIVAAVSLALILLVGTVLWLDRRRRESLRQWAEGEGWDFDAEKSDSPPFDVLRRGRNQFARFRARKSLRDPHGREKLVELCEAQYRTDRGKNSKTHAFSCAVVSLGADLPHLDAAPAGFFDALAVKFGGIDVDHPEDPDFSKLYRIRAADMADVRAVFGRDARFILMQPPHVSLSIRDGRLLAYMKGAPKAETYAFLARLVPRLVAALGTR